MVVFKSTMCNCMIIYRTVPLKSAFSKRIPRMHDLPLSRLRSLSLPGACQPWPKGYQSGSPPKNSHGADFRKNAHFPKSNLQKPNPPSLLRSTVTVSLVSTASNRPIPSPSPITPLLPRFSRLPILPFRNLLLPPFSSCVCYCRRR